MTEKILLVIGVTALCMVSPGPDMVLVMRNTLTRDRFIGGLTALGVLTGNLFHIGYCALGIGLLLSRSANAYDALRIGSALYLIYLGIQSLRSVGGDQPVEQLAASSAQPRNGYWQGLINNLLNPKGSLFYLGVFSQLITPDMSVSETVLLIAVMVSVSATFWFVFVQTLHLPIIRNQWQKSQLTVDRLFGVVLLLLAARVATM